MLAKHDTPQNGSRHKVVALRNGFLQTVQGRYDAVVFLRQTDLRVGGRILIAAADHQHRAAQQLIPHNGGV